MASAEVVGGERRSSSAPKLKRESAALGSQVSSHWTCRRRTIRSFCGPRCDDLLRVHRYFGLVSSGINKRAPKAGGSPLLRGDRAGQASPAPFSCPSGHTTMTISQETHESQESDLRRYIRDLHYSRDCAPPWPNTDEAHFTVLSSYQCPLPVIGRLHGDKHTPSLTAPKIFLTGDTLIT
jgi:hypothetical protein